MGAMHEVEHAAAHVLADAVSLDEAIPRILEGIQSGEISASAGGLIIWPARFILLSGFVLLFFQAISELIKRIAVMQGIIPDPHARQDAHHAHVE